MFTLDDIVDSSENLEMKRAIAVKMIECDFKTEDICTVLNVSDSFVSKWKVIYENQGARALKVNYQGRTGYLTDRQRTQIFLHLRDKPYCSVEELHDYIERNFGVVYQSQQPYYDILKDAGLSWHQTQAANPQRDDAEVLHTRAEIKKKLDARQAEIASGEVIVFAEDESHLLWGDTLGHVWGRRNERTVVPVINAKERQTYYGALNLHTQELIVAPYPSGNGDNTIAFLQDLPAQYPGKKLIILWDRASDHRSCEVKAYLHEINDGLAESEWPITCLPFAPHAPDQNPVEDTWLRGKNFLRKHFYENQTFAQVKRCFFNFLNKRVFNFGKAGWYLGIPQPA
jgi:transposase